jgi:hypothetical protein
VTLSSASGTLGAGASTTVTVSINSGANSLTPGSYSDTVSFTNTTNGNGNTTRPVSLTVNALPGILSVTPADGLISSGTQGGPFSPSNKNYTLQNTGASSINWTASKLQNWMTLSSTSGTLGAGASTTVTVSINSVANSLPPGSYSDTVSFWNTTNGNGNTTRPVSLTVNALPGVLSVTPADGLTSSGNQGGPFSPSSKNYTLQNTGGTSINWTASKGQAWVTLSLASGPLAAGASTTVTVSINGNANSLAPGSYSDTVSFTNTTNNSGNTTRSVNLTVQRSFSVTPAEDLISTGFEGGPFTPSSKNYTLMNTGTTSMSWSASKTQTWIKLSKTGGTLAPGASTMVTVTISGGANVLDGGTFNDTVTFTNQTNGIGNTTRSVNLTVNSILIALSSPADGETFTACSYYSPAGPPTFSWTTSGGALKKLELWFSTQSDFSSGLVKVKGPTASSNLLTNASTWKKILLLPGQMGGTVHWKVVGTKGNKKMEDSGVRSLLIEGPDSIGSAGFSHTSRTDPNPPILSWKNNCNTRFKVLFYDDPDFYNNPKKSGVKKMTLSFSITNPNDNGGVSEKQLTSRQWASITNLGSTIYWHVQSSDAIKRSVKTGPLNFVVTP